MWEQRAFICRYGHQDVFRIAGRDPLRNPLTSLETAVFARCLEELIKLDRPAADPIASRTSDDD